MHKKETGKKKGEGKKKGKKGKLILLRDNCDEYHFTMGTVQIKWNTS
jgi:hypothetical protein